MLAHLSINDFAIIDALELPLQPGLTTLTGETGAGKSILVEALTLLLGERASADVIRTGKDEAFVAGSFHLDARAGLEVDAVLQRLGLPRCEDGALVVRRVVHRAGRHRQFVNGALATVAQLKQIAEPLVDFTGQHAHQALLRPGAQLSLLDAFGDLGEPRRGVRVAYDAAKALVDERDQLRAADRDKATRGEWLAYQLDEVRALAPQVGEEDRLAAERARLMNVERLRGSVAAALACLQDGDGDALSRVQRAASSLQKVASDDDELGRLATSLNEAAVLVDDVARTLQRHGGFEDDPQRLQQVDDRLADLRQVCRKHGGTIEAVLDAAAKMAGELATLHGATERLAVLDDEVRAASAALAAACDALSAKRRVAAKKLAAAVERELADLGMKGARIDLVVEVAPAADDAPLATGTGAQRRALGPTGADKVELLLCANAGEEPRPLAKVASGGELSRFLLAVKRVLLAGDPVPVSIFDEVDAGVGGAVGEILGEKLQAVAAGRQVLCITHLPQIAARADQHLRVEKHVADGRTVSRVVALSAEERVEEVARMLGGRALTATTRAHAAEMIGAARGTSHSPSAVSPSSQGTSAPPKTVSAPSKTGSASSKVGSASSKVGSASSKAASASSKAEAAPASSKVPSSSSTPASSSQGASSKGAASSSKGAAASSEGAAASSRNAGRSTSVVVPSHKAPRASSSSSSTPPITASREVAPASPARGKTPPGAQTRKAAPTSPSGAAASPRKAMPARRGRP